MIQRRDTLKEWFKKGRYPLEEQFHDWMDSFLHLTEDALPIGNVDGLAARLNAKYGRAEGEALKAAHDTLRADFDSHKAAADGKFETVFDGMDALEKADAAIREEAREADAALEKSLTEAWQAADTALEESLAGAYKAADAALKAEIEAEIPAMPDLTGYALKTDIPAIPELDGGAAAEDGKYVSGVTVSGHTVTVTKADLPAGAEAPDLTEYAKKTDIPDLAPYALKTELPEIPELSGGAEAESGKYVSGITVSGHAVTVTKADLPAAPDLSPYALKTELPPIWKGTQSGYDGIETKDSSTLYFVTE